MLIRRLTRTLPLLVLAPLLGACALDGLDNEQSIFRAVGEVAERQVGLLIYTYWLSWFVIVLVAGVMIYSIVRFRRRRDDDEIPTQTHGNVGLEIAWTILPVLIVVAIAIPTVRTIFRTENIVQPTPDDVVINVTGYQWWWAFEYPELGIVTANEIHVPEGRRVILQMTSADVLHSFWVPKLAGKRDLIPNQNNQLWFTTDEGDTGIYPGQCAELCLGAHAYMRFRVVVDSEEEFASWVERFQAVQGPEAVVAQAQADPEIELGRQLFAQKCAACHTIAGFGETPIGEPIFPNLTNFGLRTSVAAGVLDNNADNLARWLRDPQEVKPGNRMPTLWEADDPNRDEEVGAIVAYLLSLGTDDTLSAQASAR